MKRLISIVSSFLSSRLAYAHCDVPCGIYDPKPAQIAAATVVKMVEKIQVLGLGQSIEHQNSLVRMIWTKEEHARKCKEEILILWTDFFKPEHLQMFPDLHEKFWNAAKLCSKVKQTVDLKASQDLVKVVDEIADMFSKAKSAASK